MTNQKTREQIQSQTRIQIYDQVLAQFILTLTTQQSPFHILKYVNEDVWIKIHHRLFHQVYHQVSEQVGYIVHEKATERYSSHDLL